jgi:alpha-ketoglutarate-dependent taurine dioxygenase
MQIEFPAPGIGAVVTGVDLRNASSIDFQRIYETWLDRNVIAVRGQQFTKAEFLACSRGFGRVKPHRVRRTRDPDFPEVTVMGVGGSRTADKGAAYILSRGQTWHTDSAWDTEVCKATTLYGVEIPSFGGDTLFANMYAAYDALPPPLRERIENLQVEFSYGGRAREGIELLEPEDQARPPAVHPLVRVHSETGRKSLYINPSHVVRILGISEDENERLLPELYWYMLQPGAEYRHKWQVGDFVIWDNRCSVHCAAGGCPPDQRRVHWRSTVMEPVAAVGDTTSGAQRSVAA